MIIGSSDKIEICAVFTVTDKMTCLALYFINHLITFLMIMLIIQHDIGSSDKIEMCAVFTGINKLWIKCHVWHCPLSTTSPLFSCLNFHNAK